MKIEFLHHYKRRHGHTLKDRLVAHLPRYAPLASRFAGVANARNRSPLIARLGERWLGLSARRSLPEFRADAFTRGLPAAPAPAAGRKQVVLFADTFNNWQEPENLRAARRVLEAGGYEVAVVRGADGRALCCGRTYLGTGMVDLAKDEARRTLAALLPWVRAGVAVVGLEPSCLLTMRDEFLSLGLGDEARELAAAALLFEEFVVRERQAGRFDVAFKPVAKKALVHGHCHQKAFGAMGAVAQALALVPGLEVGQIESSCCGMAGSFGYEAAHQEVSMAMAEASLLPAVRAAGAEALIVADGTSCRHQIRDGAKRDAIHVAQVLAQAL